MDYKAKYKKYKKKYLYLTSQAKKDSLYEGLFITGICSFYDFKKNIYQAF